MYEDKLQISSDLTVSHNSYNESELKVDYDKLNAYNPYSTPPSLDIAKKHGLARKISKQQSTSSTGDHCLCCNLPITNDEIKCTESDLEQLGICFPLYFNFLKSCIILLLLMYIVIGLFNLFIVFTAPSSYDYTKILALALKQLKVESAEPSEYKLDGLLKLSFIFFFICMYKFMSRKHFRAIGQYHHYIVNPSDYAVLITKLKSTKYNKDELTTFIESFLDPITHPHVKQVVLIDDIEQLKTLRDKKNILKRLISTAKSTNKIEEYQKLTNDCNNTELKIMQIQNDLFNFDHKNGINNIESAIVVFDDCQFVKNILKKLKFDNITKIIIKIANLFGFMKRYRFKNLFLLRVIRAPEPTDIKWENMNHGQIPLIIRRLLIYIIAFGIVVFCYLVVSMIYSWKLDNYKSYLHSFAGSLVILTINLVLKLLIMSYSSFQKNKSYSSESKGIFFFLVISQFANTALVNFMCQADSFAVLDKIAPGLMLLAINMFFVFLSNAILNPLLNIYDPIYIYRSIRRWIIEKQGDKCTLTQDEVNVIYEDPEFDFSVKYANIIITMFVTAFYGPIMPIGILIALFEMILIYKTDQYILKKRKTSTPTRQLSSDLPTYILNNFVWFIGIYALGMNNFDFIVTVLETEDITKIKPAYYSTISRIAVILSFVYCIVPFHKFCNFCREEDTKRRRRHTDLYDKAKEKFMGYQEVLDATIAIDDGVDSSLMAMSIVNDKPNKNFNDMNASADNMMFRKKYKSSK